MCIRDSLEDTVAVTALLGSLRSAGTREQVSVLAARAAAHVTLDDTRGIAWLLDSLRENGAHEQVAVLAARAAAHVSLDDSWAAGQLLDSLRTAGAGEQAAALAGSLPGAGMFRLFREQDEDNWDRFRFGREADGSPARPWGWEDLD